MLSSKIQSLLSKIDSDPKISKSQKEAVNGARQRLSIQAPGQVCLTCEKADFFVFWAKLEKDDEWIFALSKCDGGVILSPNDACGLNMPGACFCSAEYEKKGKLA
jgi:hypothetical protein